MVQQPVREPGDPVERDGQADEEHRRPEHGAHERQRDRQQERGRQDRAEHQHALLADVAEQLAQRDHVPLHGSGGLGQRGGKSFLGIAELDGGHAGTGSEGPTLGPGRPAVQAVCHVLAFRATRR